LAIFIVLQIVHNVVKLNGHRGRDRMVVGFTTT